ncbi:MAG: hypothetical protein ACRD2A_24960 [Vicinamibacterales bacterium]
MALRASEDRRSEGRQMIAVFAAMDSEVAPFLAAGTVRGTEVIDGFSTTRLDFGGLRAVLCRTGIGARAASATSAVLNRHPARAVLSVGTAGALSPRLRAGDAIICDPVSVSSSCGYGDEDGSIKSDPALFAATQEAAQRFGLALEAGSSLTVNPAVATAEEKRRLWELLGHDVVEMESYWVGRVAAERDLPFLTVRVVSDDAGDAIIVDAGFVRADGTIDYDLLAQWAQQHPDQMTLLGRMAERSRSAGDTLSRFARTLPGLNAAFS